MHNSFFVAPSWVFSAAPPLRSVQSVADAAHHPPPAPIIQTQRQHLPVRSGDLQRANVVITGCHLPIEVTCSLCRKAQQWNVRCWVCWHTRQKCMHLLPFSNKRRGTLQQNVVSCSKPPLWMELYCSGDAVRSCSAAGEQHGCLQWRIAPFVSRLRCSPSVNVDCSVCRHTIPHRFITYLFK